MATKSSNTQGNPYHDEEGKFTSANDSGSKESKIEEKTTTFALENSPKPKIKLKIGASLDNLVSQLNDINAPSNVPQLRSARDIEANVDKFFSRQVMQQIDSVYGKSNDCADYQFHPKSNPRATLEIFPNILGKNRYKDNHATIVSSIDFYKLVGSHRYTRIWRGMGNVGEVARQIIRNYSLIDLKNFDYYGPNSGNCYGSNIYTTINYSYAHSFARYGSGTIIEGLLDDKSSNYMDYYQVTNIMNSINADVCVQKVESKLLDFGMEASRARQIARGFGIAIKKDPGLVAICMGLDFYISDRHQRNLFNLSKWIIRGN